MTNPGPWKPNQPHPGQSPAQHGDPTKKRGGCFKWGGITVAVLVALFVIVGLAGGWDADDADAADTSTNEPTGDEHEVDGEPVDDDDPTLLDRTHEMHHLIDLAFEGCDWDIQEEGYQSVMGMCEEHQLFTVVTPVESATLNIMEAMADATPVAGYYAIEDGAGVLAFDAGDRNLAQDLLGGWALDNGSF